jgi:hypothetical protein
MNGFLHSDESDRTVVSMCGMQTDGQSMSLDSSGWYQCDFMHTNIGKGGTFFTKLKWWRPTIWFWPHCISMCDRNKVPDPVKLLIQLIPIFPLYPKSDEHIRQLDDFDLFLDSSIGVMVLKPSLLWKALNNRKEAAPAVHFSALIELLRFFIALWSQEF